MPAWIAVSAQIADYSFISVKKLHFSICTKGFFTTWTASSEFGTYRLCEQRRFTRACASAQSRQNLRCSLMQAVSQVEPSDRKPDPWPFWMAEHAQLKFVMTECSKTQIRLTRPIYRVTYVMLLLHDYASTLGGLTCLFFCGLYSSKNHSVQNSPWGWRGSIAIPRSNLLPVSNQNLFQVWFYTFFFII